MRRRSFRVHVRGGSAICETQLGNDLYKVGDVSLHGIRLVGGRVLPPESVVQADIWWPGVGSCRARARVVRTVETTAETALEFINPDGELKLLVDALTQIGTMRGSNASTLIFVHDESNAGRVVKAMTRLGKRVLVARTPLDAIAMLSDPWAPITAVMFDSSPQGLEMAKYLRDEEPAIRRLFVPVGGSIHDGQTAVVSGLAQEIRAI